MTVTVFIIKNVFIYECYNYYGTAIELKSKINTLKAMYIVGF